MKMILIILSVYALHCIGQTDTMVWDLSKKQLINQSYPDGYHIFKKQGIIIEAYRLVNGRLDGILKLYYDSGALRSISDHKRCYDQDLTFYCGIYKEFYESGMLKTDGNYEFADSVACISCFDLADNKQYKNASTKANRTGLWVAYHESGQPESVGAYNGVHETYYTDYPKPTGEPGAGAFIPGGYSEAYLKDKAWQYYNDKGQLIREEYFFNGVLVDVKTYDQ